VSWVKHAVLIALARQGRPVRVPLNRLADLGKMKRAMSALRTELGREPTMPELVLKTGLSKKVIVALQGVECAELRLDALGSGDAGETLGLSADDNTGVEAEAEHTFLGHEIDEALGSLTPRERRVLNLHFGLGGEHEHTLEEISSVFGLTRERIRQIRERALMTLRRGKFAGRLASFA
jgi:RNA polymerase primary sigma factor